jgi:hypothetical protein
MSRLGRVVEPQPMSRRNGRMRRGAWLVVACLVAGCAPPQVEGTTPSGDHVVTTWSRLFGLDSTKWNNVEAARANCPEGYIVLGETIGQDNEGNYRRWEYGCLER